MTAQIGQTLTIIDIIKNNSAIPIVLGEVHPTLYPTQTCQYSDVNFVIVGMENI